MGRLLASVLIAPTLLISTGCLGADDQKGDEDDELVDGKADSFGNPTEHGVLTFGSPSRASFTDTSGFHSWTFTLTDNASVVLKTVLETANLDTVVYLYKRTSPTGSWGAYIAKNDDESSHTAASRVAQALDAGEYRVIVKTYKRTQRGTFSLAGTCSGAGCPVTGQTACPAPAKLPADTGYGGTCAETFASVFATGDVATSSSTSVTIADRCDADALTRLAADYYKDYWSFDDELTDDTDLDTTIRQLGGANGGYVVDVTDGGDESAISFIFDHDQRLVALYQHNQSPDARFYCKEASAAEVTLPRPEDCVGGFVSYVVHEVGESAQSGQLSAGQTTEPGELSRPVRRYAAAQGLSTTTKVTYQGTSWNEYEGVSRLTLSVPNRLATTFISTAELVLLEQPAGGEAKLVCD